VDGSPWAGLGPATAGVTFFGGSFMTEPDQIEFHERVNGPDGGRPGPSLSRSVPVRIGIVAGSALLFVIGAVAAMGASPTPSTQAGSPDTTTVPDAPVPPIDGLPFDGVLPK